VESEKCGTDDLLVTLLQVFRKIAGLDTDSDGG
jgi:hypothetical protein